jgi:hypothetical protein
MRSRAAGGNVLFILAVAFASDEALGAPGPAPIDDGDIAASLADEPRALYRLGRELYSSGDAAAALQRFTRAYELSSEPRLLWNLAACEARLRHWARAMTLLDRYEAAAPTESARDREQTAQFRAAAQPLVATVDVSGIPAGVTIAVDGEIIGQTPLGLLYLDGGSRRVRFTRPGYRGLVRVDTVGKGSHLVWTITLEPLRIRLLGND